MKLRRWMASLIAAAMIVAGVGWFSLRPVPRVSVDRGPTSFQTSEAMLYLSDLTTMFPRRDYAAPGRRAAAEWLSGEFGRLGLNVYTQEFSEVIAGKRVEGLQNVFAVLPGQISKAILVVAHYDLPPFVREGAGDDASGVATLLELARVFARTNPRWTMVFLASDSEEYGAMAGSYHFLEQSGWKGRLAAVVSLDFANLGTMAGIRLRDMGIHQGYAPLWLRELAKRSIAVETPALDPGPVQEWLERAVAVAPTEHGAYLETGIPAVDLSGVPANPAAQAARYHTFRDTLDQVRPETLGRYGRAAERLLRGLQDLKDWPAGEMRYFRLGGWYLPGRAVVLLQLVALWPLVAGMACAWRRTCDIPGRERLRQVWGEVRQLGALFLAGCLGYLVLWQASERGLMIKYELYPATQKDPVLSHPQVLPLLLVAVALAGGYLFWRWALRVGGGAAPEVRRAVGLTGLLALCVAGILGGGGFAILALLGPAILFWPLVRSASGLAGRLLGLAAALSVLTVFTTFLVLFGRLYAIGVIWWYLLMAAAYGLFRARAVLAFLAAAALVIRFAAAAWSSGDDPASEVEQPN